MFQRILVLLVVNVFVVSYSDVALQACDCWSKNIDETEKLYEIRSVIRMQVDARLNQHSPSISRRKKKSLETFVESYGCYFYDSMLVESVENSSMLSKSLKRPYSDFLNLIIDGFTEMPKEWHSFYDFGIARELKSSSEDCLYPFRFIDVPTLELVSKRIARLKELIFDIPLDMRDSVCWHVTQTAENYQSCPDLPDSHHLLKLVCEIPKEHHDFILKKNMFGRDQRVEKWLRAVRQSNVAEYYAPLMYKFIPFLDSKSFWSIFVDYSHSVPTEEHLNDAFNLFYERITNAYMLPRSREATEALRYYLEPLFPVSLLCMLRFNTALKLRW